MRYFLFILLFFIGCSNQNEKKIYINDVVEINSTVKSKSNKIEIENLTFYEKNSSLSYDFNQSVLLVFVDENKYSQLQLKELNKTHKKFYIISNQKLEKYFKIKKYPTILIIDKNSTKRYEGFIPYEILKYEIKD